MGIQVIKDGQIIHSDKKETIEDQLKKQQKIIQDLQNQIKDLKKTKNK